MADDILIQEARDWALRLMAILEGYPPDKTDKLSWVGNAQRCALHLNARLMEFQCQLTGQSAKGRNGS